MDRLHVPVDAVPAYAAADSTSVTVTITGRAGSRIAVFGFGGGAVGQASKCELQFVTTTKALLRAVAGASAQRYSPVGLVAGDGENVLVVTTPAASAVCEANIEYIFVVA